MAEFAMLALPACILIYSIDIIVQLHKDKTRSRDKWITWFVTKRWCRKLLAVSSFPNMDAFNHLWTEYCFTIVFVIVLMCYCSIDYVGLLFIFTARSSYASAVLGIVILSVRLSVRLTVCPAHACFVTKRKNIQLKFWHHMKECSV